MLKRDAGLTLTEMLVTLAILAVMAGVATLSVGAFDRTGGAEAEARRLAAEITLAADRATLDRRTRVLNVRSGGWTLAGAEHELPSGLRLRGDDLEGRTIIAPDGAAPPASFTVEGVSAWRVTFDGLRASAAPAGAAS